jgi:hypothetical protein
MIAALHLYRTPECQPVRIALLGVDGPAAVGDGLMPLDS